MHPSQPLFKALRRLALTTKQAANKGGYYKGTRTGSQGWHTIWGGYIIDMRKVRTYVTPERLAREQGTDLRDKEHIVRFVMFDAALEA
jgi:large subunit ribosomal protein L41